MHKSSDSMVALTIFALSINERHCAGFLVLGDGGYDKLPFRIFVPTY